MSGHDQELSRLLSLYRKGHISEEVLLAQMRELDGRAAVSEGDTDASAERADAGEPSQAQRAVDEPSPEEPADEAPSMAQLLDAYRVAETCGAEALRAWSELSSDAALIGGLRVLAAREAAHAALLEERARELGGLPRARTPDWMTEYNASIADPKATDLDRLASLVAQFPDVAAAVAPLQQTIDAIEDDDLTKELLQAICEDEIATLKWVHAAYASCGGGPDEKQG